jgi:hypothetical protein
MYKQLKYSADNFLLIAGITKEEANKKEREREKKKTLIHRNSEINIIQTHTSPPMANLAPSVLKARHFCGPTDSSGGASLGIMRTVNSSNISLNNLLFGKMIW